MLLPYFTALSVLGYLLLSFSSPVTDLISSSRTSSKLSLSLESS